MKNSNKSWVKYRKQGKTLKSKQYKQSLRSYNPEGRKTQDVNCTFAVAFSFRAFSSLQCKIIEAKQEMSVLLVQDYQMNWNSKGEISDKKKPQRSESKNLCTNFPQVTDWFLSCACIGRDPKNLRKIEAKMPVNWAVHFSSSRLMEICRSSPTKVKWFLPTLSAFSWDMRKTMVYALG